MKLVAIEYTVGIVMFYIYIHVLFGPPVFIFVIYLFI